MEAATVPGAEQLEKRLYRNNTAGYLGVVKLDHKGDPYGENVDPHGTVWLSDAEATLTARAPRKPEDNPFEEQMFVMQDSETGRREEVPMRPLTLADDDGRFVPDERYTPTQAEREAQAQATRPVQHSAAASDAAPPAPPSTGSENAQSVPPPTPPVAPQTAAVPSPRSERAPLSSPAPEAGISGAHVATEADEPVESWTEPPAAPGQVLTGSLAGDDGPTDAPDATNHPGAGNGPTAGQAQAAPQQPGAEEHAAAVDPAVGEETGAARPPVQPQPEGEYAQAEEVGSPDAPAANDEPLIGG
jgi:hypothetical protein